MLRSKGQTGAREAAVEFAALLKADSCGDANLDFATRYQGQAIAFNGSIVSRDGPPRHHGPACSADQRRHQHRPDGRHAGGVRALCRRARRYIGA
ncbi:DUF4839 domain-containing protein [Streptomyces sp. NBC_01518]